MHVYIPSLQARIEFGLISLKTLKCRPVRLQHVPIITLTTSTAGSVKQQSGECLSVSHVNINKTARH